MSKIAKMCKHHGALTTKQAVMSAQGVLCCKLCRMDYSINFRAKHKDELYRKCLIMRALKEENKLTKVCKIHGKLKNKDINIDVRAIMSCLICITENRYKRKEILKMNQCKGKRKCSPRLAV